MARGDASFQRLTAAQLDDALVLVLFGSDQGLIDSAARDLARRLAIARSVQETTRLQAGEIVSDPSALVDFFAGVSLFGDRRLLWIDGVSERLASTCADFLRGAPENSGDVVLLSTHLLKSRSRILDAFRQDSRCLTISCYDAGADRSSIRATLSDRGLTIDDDALDQLIEISQSLDPSSFRDVLEKTWLLSAEGGRVDAGIVDAAAPPQSGARDADLLSAALGSRRAGLYHLFQSDLQDGGSASGFLAMLGRALGTALPRARGGRGGGKLHFRSEEAVKRALARHSDLGDRIERILVEIHRTEMRLRSGSSQEREEVERLLIRAAQTLNAGSR